MSCFFTLFICAWVAIHPNIPNVTKTTRPFQSLYVSWKLIYERLVLVFIFIIFPEFILAWALVQREAANHMLEHHSEWVQLN